MMSKALLWVKTNWKWVVLPVGILLWLLGRASKKTEVQLQSSSLDEHEDFKSEIELKVERQLKAAGVERDAQLEAIQKANDAALKEINEKAEQKAKELQSNPDNVNAFLKQVGKDVRTGPKA